MEAAVSRANQAMIAAAALLSACGGSGAANEAAPGPNMNVASAEATTDQTILKGGWATLFADPAATVDAFGRVGLRPGPYAPGDGGFVSKAIPTPLANVGTAEADIANVELRGPDAKRIDRVIFTLDLNGKHEEAVARRRFNDLIRQAFDQVGLPGREAVKPAIDAEKAVKGAVAGAAWTVERVALPHSGARRLIVIFTPAGATPASNQPRN